MPTATAVKPASRSKATGRQGEFNTKLERIRGYLKAHALGGVVLNSQNLFAWATGGGENYVVLGHDFGVGYLLVTPESVTMLANNIEIHRFAAEEFHGIDARGIEFWSCPWHTDHQIVDEVRRRMGSQRFASDCAMSGSTPLHNDFMTLTYTLTENEIARYRKLGKDCSLAMEEALKSVRPGITEYAVAGLICRGMFDHGVRPQLALVASDERVSNFRHPIPVAKKVRKHMMAVLCGKRGGLIINLTRMVHFARKLPDELRRKHDAVCAVDVALNTATKPGLEMKDVFEVGLAEYRRQDFADEWKLHHQGGPTGYQGRSFRGTPTETRTVLAPQAFAWNPSITGTKSEDTIVVTGDARKSAIEFLSGPTGKWPTVAVKRDGKTYKRSDVKLM
jgi:Xaa-Pro dipeptidase